jgi:hypothetical protein
MEKDPTKKHANDDSSLVDDEEESDKKVYKQGWLSYGSRRGSGQRSVQTRMALNLLRK